MTAPRIARKTRQFQVALYVVAGLVLLDQVSQLVVGIYPFHPDRVNWRYASFTVTVGYVATLLLADLLVIAAGSGLGHRVFLRFWAILHLLSAAALLVAVGLFVLDATEMRALVQQDVRGAILTTSARVAIVALLATGALVFMAVYLWRLSRKHADERGAHLLMERPAERTSRP